MHSPIIGCGILDEEGGSGVCKVCHEAGKGGGKDGPQAEGGEAKKEEAEGEQKGKSGGKDGPQDEDGEAKGEGDEGGKQKGKGGGKDGPQAEGGAKEKGAEAEKANKGQSKSPKKSPKKSPTKKPRALARLANALSPGEAEKLQPGAGRRTRNRGEK